ncbi:hypothetical protein D9M70_605900 [compost metagenome]
MNRNLAAGPLRHELVGKEQEDAADQRQRRTDWREVEHREALAGQFLADTRHDDIRRGADLRHQPADQRTKGHRHQEDRRLDIRPPGKLEGDRQHDRQRPDILDEGGKHRHRDDQQRKLGPDG